MAVIAFMIGGLLGITSGIVALLLLDVPVPAAFALYFEVSIATGIILICARNISRELRRKRQNRMAESL